MTRYRKAVMSLLLRLLLLTALLFMPLGMGAATAAVGSAHGAATPMPASHCSDDSDRMDHSAKGTAAECTMACASMLPAFEPVRLSGPVGQRAMIAAPFIAAPLHGILADIATPPPRGA